MEVDSPLQPPPETKVGQNSLILQRIFIHSAPKDLLTARLVNKLWLDEATKAAVKRQCLKSVVPLKSGVAAVSNFVKVTESSTFPTNTFQWDLSRFGRTVPPYGPGHHFTRAIEGQTSPLQVFEQFSQLKTATETLLRRSKCLIVVASKELKDDAIRFFWGTVGQNTSIEELHYAVLGRPANSQPLEIRQFSFLNLHTIVVDPAKIGKSLIDLERILMVAANLQKVVGCTPRFLRMIHRTGKTACVKKLDLSKLDSANVNVLQFCMNSGFKFEEVSFEFREREGVRSFEELRDRIEEMELGQEVVDEIVAEEMDLDLVRRLIELDDEFEADNAPAPVAVVNINQADQLEKTLGDFLVHNRLSVKYLKCPSLRAVNAVLNEDVKSFTALKKLHLYDPKSTGHDNATEIPKTEAVLHVGVNLNVVFPNLDTVVFDLKSLSRAYLQKYFPDDDLASNGKVHAITSVKKLIIKCGFDNDGMEFISKKFPNLKHVTVYQVIGSYSHALNAGVWRLPEGLQTVTFHFRIKRLNLEIKKLDDMLLGLKRHELGSLEEARKEGMLDVEILRGTRYMRRDRVAITRFKELEVLKIVLDTDDVLKTVLKKAIRRSPDAKKIKQRKEQTDFFLESEMISPVCAILLTGLMRKTKFVVEFDGQGKYANGILERLDHLKPYFDFDGSLKSYDYVDD